MCSDPEVMKFFPSTLTLSETQNLIDRLTTHFEEFGFTYFAIDVLDTGEFIGFTGIKHQTFNSEYTPCIDIGWRLKKSAHGKGYATEAAQACIDFAFSELNLKEVLSFAAKGNIASENVMKKIGMHFIGNFEHPGIKDDPRFPYCFTYKIEQK